MRAMYLAIQAVLSLFMPRVAERAASWPLATVSANHCRTTVEREIAQDLITLLHRFGPRHRDEGGNRELRQGEALRSFRFPQAGASFAPRSSQTQRQRGQWHPWDHLPIAGIVMGRAFGDGVPRTIAQLPSCVSPSGTSKRNFTMLHCLGLRH